MKVIIAGTRHYQDYETLKHIADKALHLQRKVTILSGTCKGADRLGERYARERGHQIERHPANWIQHGKKAAFIRNYTMARNADALLAFWDGESKGTKMMIELAKKHGLKVHVVVYK